MRGMNLKDRIQKVIDQRRTQLIKERDEYERKMHDTVSYYGLGGAYRRQEAARDKREEQLNELDDFEKQLKNTTRHFEARTLTGILCRMEAQQQQCSEVVTKQKK